MVFYITQREITYVGEHNSAGSGWIYTYESPLVHGGWLDTYYLSMMLTSQMVLGTRPMQTPFYNEHVELNY